MERRIGTVKHDYHVQAPLFRSSKFHCSNNEMQAPLQRCSNESPIVIKKNTVFSSVYVLTSLYMIILFHFRLEERYQMNLRNQGDGEMCRIQRTKIFF